MILSLTFARSLGKFENLGLRPQFQHFPRDLANNNEWKIMYDPSIETLKTVLFPIILLLIYIKMDVVYVQYDKRLFKNLCSTSRGQLFKALLA